MLFFEETLNLYKLRFCRITVIVTLLFNTCALCKYRMALSRVRKWRNSFALGLHSRKTIHAPEIQPLTPPEGFPRLPPELCDRIIDYLHDDRQALAVCNLTCRSWVPASRFHHFRCVHLTPANCARFEELLETTPAVARYVADLTVDFPSMFYLRNKKAREQLPQLLKRVFVYLQWVTILKIREVNVSAKTIDLFATLSTTVECLEFGYLAAKDEGLLTKLVCSFPHLQTLKLPCFTFLGHGAVSLIEQPNNLPPMLRSLQLRLPYSEYADRAVQWLVGQSILQKLQELEICVVVHDSLSLHALAALFLALGPSLGSLEVDLSRTIPLQDVQFDLVKCTNLRHIRFAISPRHQSPHYRWLDSRVFDPCPTNVATFLSRIKTRSVQTIVFSMRPRYIEGLHDLAWIEEVALPLSCPEFSQLQNVIFEIIGGRYEREIRSFIKKEIPELCVRGIVSVRSVAPWDPWAC